MPRRLVFRSPGDDTSAGLVAVFVAMKYQRANGDRLVHGAVGTEITDGAAVQSAPYRLELLDDFHGP